MAKITLPGALGVGALGAYGYNHAQEYLDSSGMGDVVRGFGRMLGANMDKPSSSGRVSTTNSSGGGESQTLQKEIDRLHNLLSDAVRGKNGQGVHVIHTGQGSSWKWVVYSLAGGGVVYAYCRIRGISVMDLFFVSRGSMQQFRSTVSEGFGKLWDEMRKQKDDFVARLASLVRGQEQLSETQLAMDERLRQVGDNVDGVRANTAEINGRVQQLDERMAEVHDGVLRTNQGIMLLCSTVHEVTQRIGMKNSKQAQALDRFVGSGGGSTATLPPSAQFEVLEGPSPSPSATGGQNGLLGLIDAAPQGADGVARLQSASSAGGAAVGLGTFASGLKRFMPS